MDDRRPSRREMLRQSAVGAVALGVGGTGVLGATLGGEREASAGQSKDGSMAASPPAGFVPFARPGHVVKVTKKDSLQANQKYPKPEDAKAMLTRVLMELTGKGDLKTAIAQFVHPSDIVCVKVNGIAGTNMGTNKELVLPFLEGMIESGVKPENITVLEQYGDFLAGTRINQGNVPKGVKVTTHSNKDATMGDRMIPGTGTTTKFVRALTEATAAINFALVKDHSICGYTGALKNMTHGCSINPHDFHAHHASPQIAMMYAQDVIKSRVRLCIADAYKVMAHGGPKWKYADYVKVHEAVYASTDPVAIDAIGWEVVEEHRKGFNLKTLTAEGRPPAYIKAAADLGLGVAERSQITLKDVTV
ncbi:MAG: DUF362 domain-containing protein [Polyangiaceae bacterium]